MVKTNFTTQWSNDNILISIDGGMFIRFFSKVFFKSWLTNENKMADHKIILQLGTLDKKEELIEEPFFVYQRVIDNKKIITKIGKLNFVRALVRSLYKFIFNNGSMVGVPELFMMIIRKSVFEPIEYFNLKQGWHLIHASAFEYKNKVFVLVAGSKIGKSTMISELRKTYKIQVLSDNYCLIKGDKVRTIEEPFRSASPNRFKIVFYNRSLNGRPEKFEGDIDFLIHMDRGKNNAFSRTNPLTMKEEIQRINDKEKEGICYLSKIDPIRTPKIKLELKGQKKLYSLIVAEGMENVEIAINKVIKLA